MGIRRSLAVALSLVLSGSWLPAADGDLAARIHFAGTTSILADPNATKLKEISALPESGVLWDEIVGKLASAPFRAMNQHSPPRKEDHAAQLRPLAQDILRSESYCEIRGTTNFWPEVALAVKLDDAHAGVWNKTLSSVLTDWTGIAVKDIEIEGLKGWELRKHHNPDVFQFVRVGDWVVFGWGEHELRLQPALVKKIKSEKRPVAADNKNLLAAWVDWPKFSGGQAGSLPAKLSKIELTVQARKDFLRPELKLHFAEPLGIKIDPWKFPTNLIGDTVSSITLARGFGPLLAKVPELRDLGSDPLPNEVVLWAMPGEIPFLTTAVAPVADSKNYLMRIAPGLISLINSDLAARNTPGKALLTTNMSVVIHGFAILAPFLRATNDASSDYLIGGIFALPPAVNPFPWNALYNTISAADVIYYQREMNGERMYQWRALSQLYFMITARTLPKTDTPAQNWLMAIKSKLDDCRTVGTLTAPDEVTFVRNAPLGLTGFELTWLALWVDSSGFPLTGNIETATPINANLLNPHR